MKVRSRQVVTVALLAMFAAGCSGGTDPYLGPAPTGGAMPVQQQFADLMRRPTIDEAVARYTQLQTKLKDKLSADLGITGWRERPGTSSEGGCQPAFTIDSGDARQQHLTTWFTDAKVADNQHDAAKTTVAAVVKEYGFAEVSLDLSRPGDLQYNLKDQFGAELGFGSAKNTILTLDTGCHLTVDAKQRGVPRAS